MGWQKSGNYRADLDRHLAQHQVADIPVLTGFGVSVKLMWERFNAVSDGVIVGSKIVKALHQESRFRTLSNKQ